MAAQTASRCIVGQPVGRTAKRMLGVVVSCCLGHAGTGFAFPLLELPNQNSGPAITDLATPDEQDLRHQLQLVNGLPIGKQGWTFIPRLGIEEAFTDNILQVNTPRRWDLTTYIAPGIAITADTRRLRLRLDYSPILVLNARTGSQNALNQQLNATATVTAIDELAFVDLRALAGVQSTRGGIGGAGTIGAGDVGGITAGGGISTRGFDRQSEVQTTSAAISPYLLHQFGEYGTGRLGYSLGVAQYSPISGFKFFPIPTGGGAQSLITMEEFAEFKSGEYFGDVQDTLSVDLTQSNSSYQGNQFGTTGNTFNPYSNTSVRNIITNQVSYAVNHSIAVNVSVGHETIRYAGVNRLTIDDFTWSVGATLTPNPNSTITFSYGHQQGADAFSFDARYQLTPRVLLTGSYSNTVGTQLENVQRQLNQGVINTNGGFVSGTTGGPLFGGTNALAIQPGVFRYHSFSASATTTLERDTIALVFFLTNQATAGATTTGQFSSDATTAQLSWMRDLRPDLKLSSSASYSLLSGGGGGGGGGGGTTVAFNTALQYAMTDSLTTSVRYTYFNRSSRAAVLNIYENLLIFGITKLF